MESSETSKRMSTSNFQHTPSDGLNETSELPIRNPGSGAGFSQSVFIETAFAIYVSRYLDRIEHVWFSYYCR